jgi:hypothetical protein
MPAAASSNWLNAVSESLSHDVVARLGQIERIASIAATQLKDCAFGL